MAHIEYLKDLDAGYLEHANSRAGYVGPIRIPLKIALAIITWQVRISHAWKLTFRPHLLHPHELTGHEGEPPYFLRADLAKTPHAVREYWLDQWMGPRVGYRGDQAAEVAAAKEELERLRECLDPMEPVDHIVMVWMVERHDPTKDPDYDDDACWYDPTTRDTPGAVAYWRWDEK